MKILKINKSILLLGLFASISNAEIVSLSCDDEKVLDFFKYYLIKLDTNKMVAERTMSYIYGGSDGPRYGYSYQKEQQKKVAIKNLRDNYYQIDHYLSYSTKVAINRSNPAESLVWIDASWNRFKCELIPEKIINLKIEELNSAEAKRKAKNIF